MTQRIDMGGGEIGDVDVVADAGAVGGVVVFPEYLNMVPLAGDDLAGDLDQVGGVG